MIPRRRQREADGVTRQRDSRTIAPIKLHDWIKPQRSSELEAGGDVVDHSRGYANRVQCCHPLVRGALGKKRQNRFT